MFSNSDKYEGEFKNNKKNGVGLYTFKDGTKIRAKFMDDEKIENLELED